MNMTNLTPAVRHWTDHDTLTVQEAAEVLRLGRTAAYEAVKRREIPTLRVGGRILVPVPQLKDMLGYTARSA